MAPQLAWIGLGNMGKGMCKNLVLNGNLQKSLIVYNRTSKRVEDLISQLPQDKVAVASTLLDLIRQSDIIMTCVSDDEAINEIIDAALVEDITGKLFVDCTTVHPGTASALANRISAKGAGYVASPVFGSPAMANEGQLVFVLAGDAIWTEKAKPYTSGVMGRACIDFSGQPQTKALLLKVISNAFIFNLIELLSASHTLAEKSGLGTANLHQFIEILFPGPYTAYSNRLLSGDYYNREEPLVQVDLARKNVGHLLSLAHSAEVKLPSIERVDQLLDTVQRQQGRNGDIAGIYGSVRLENGLPFKNHS